MPGQQDRFIGGGLAYPYVEGLRMDEAMHPLTLLTFGLYGEVLPKQNGAPVRISDVATAIDSVENDKVASWLDGTRAILLRNGDLFERDLKSGALVQITRGVTAISDPQYSADGAAVQYRSGTDWFSWSRADRLSAPVALLRAAKDPDAKPEADALREQIGRAHV